MMQRKKSASLRKRPRSAKSMPGTWAPLERRITKKFTSSQRILWDAFVFLLRFLALAIPFNLLLWSNFDAYHIQVFVARAVSYLLEVSGVGVVQADNFIYIRSPIVWTIEIIKDCVGWKSFLALCGLVFAVRGVHLKKRIIGMAAGLPVIFFGNIFRIYTSLYAGVVLGTDKFPVIHEFLWQAGMMALIICAWIVWMKYYAMPRRR